MTEQISDIAPPVQSHGRRLILSGAINRVGPMAGVLLSFAAVVAVWWLIALILNRSTLLPSPLQATQRGWQLLAGDDGQLNLRRNIYISVERVLIGWAGAVVGGIFLGSLMAMSRVARMLLDPIVEFWRPLPPLAFAPLLVVWLGFGEMPKILLILLASIPIMIIATLSGVKAADESRIQCALMLGATPLQILRHVLLPNALPEIMTGVRLASGNAWGTLVAAELLASDRGIGYMILRASSYLDTKAVFVGIVVIGMLASGMDALLRIAERKLVPWKGKPA
jgi:taurine transport system permease protein